MPFKKGHKLAPGGARANSGRPTDEFKKKMLALSDSPAAWKFRKDVIEGNPIEERIIVDLVTGKEIKTLVTPSIENRRKMLADIDDRAHGKAAQVLANVDGESFPFAVIRPDDRTRVA
jgi:hypothetical protein